MSTNENTSAGAEVLRDKSIGHFIAQANNLSADEVEQILKHQKREGLRFGEAAVALGTPQWKMILLVTLRAVRAGVITGILLAIARISGETAPLLFTALNNQFWTTNLNAPMSNLPVVIFQFAMSPYSDWQELAWAGALMITLTVLVLNIVARLFFRQKAAK